MNFYFIIKFINLFQFELNDKKSLNQIRNYKLYNKNKPLN